MLYPDIGCLGMVVGLLNACSGHKTRSVIVLSSGQVVLSSLQPIAVKARIDKCNKDLKEVSHVI